MNPANITTIIVSIAYYVIVGFLALFSFFAVYILMRYARNKIWGAIACLIYALFFLTLLQQSHAALLAL